jgi:prophage DNA circulation protein
MMEDTRQSTANDLARLIVDTLQLSSFLLQAIRNVPNHEHVIELKTRFEVLSTALQKLQQMLVSTDADFTTLKAPIQTCLNTCEECQRKISGMRNPSLSECSESIIGITRTLKLYTSTLVIGMIDIGMYVY